LQKTYRALALFSGGLDSLLAVLWMKKLGVEVIPIFFRTPFFTEERAKQTARANGLELEVIDIAEKHLTMLQNPRYGFGKNFNPCIDCHGLMFRLAGDLLPDHNADFLISGEVLSQRPMSQRKDAMNAVGKLSGHKDLLIRPLCQVLIDDTKPIREGWIDKSELLSFNGRSRKPQLALAKELGVIEFPSPAGGCRLTDRNFSIRLRDLVETNQLNLPAINLLKYGRHFRLDNQTKFIIGRDEKDNQGIMDYSSANLLLLNEDIPGPLGLLCCSELTDDRLQLACSLLAYYNSKSPEIVKISYGCSFPLPESLKVHKATLDKINQYMIKE
jgi:tRNA-specific 2-thiouridylase